MTHSTEWFSLDQAAAAGDPSMPTTRQGWQKVADAEGWRTVPGLARRQGKGWFYNLRAFPLSTQTRLLLKLHAERDEQAQREKSSDLWRWFESLPDQHREASLKRLKAVQYAHQLMDAGMTLVAAAAVAAAEAGVSVSTLRNWLKAVKPHNRADWLAALAPEYKATASFAECHAGAWAVLKSDYLRPERPAFSACYRRMLDAAKRNNWGPIPSEMALRRRLAAEVPRSTQIVSRDGKVKADALHPAQRRTRVGQHAMSLVNIDGHKFDVWVRRPPHSETIYKRSPEDIAKPKPFRPMLIAIQDIYSGKFLAWRLDETESRVPVRLAIGDMVEHFGIPDSIVLDNGRAFASRDISGGADNRFRYPVRDDEPDGLLTQLGIKIHWAKPHHGQSKPIERAFRDLCENIAKHPFCAGAYTGNTPLSKPDNYGSRAIEWDAFKQFVDRMIAEHNARPGRNTEIARGRSFDETFAASMAEPTTLVQWPTEEQRALWSLMVEEITAQRGNGQINLMGNTYWAPPMVQYAGTKVRVRFDPDDLSKPIRVYDRKGKLLATAEAFGPVQYLDAGAAQRTARAVAKYRKAEKQLRDMHVALKPEELGAIFAPPAPKAAKSKKPAVTRLATGSKKTKPSDWQTQSEDGFGVIADLIAERSLRRRA